MKLRDLLPEAVSKRWNQNDGIWTETTKNHFSTEASTIQANGGSRKVMLPRISEPIYRLKWHEHKDREGDVTHWVAKAYGMTLTIFND